MALAIDFVVVDAVAQIEENRQNLGSRRSVEVGKQSRPGGYPAAGATRCATRSVIDRNRPT